MIFKPLYKKAQVAGKINKWTIEVVGNGYRTISGYDDGVQTTTEWTYCQGKNVGKANGTTAEQQALKEAEALYTKRIDSGYHANISDSHVSKFFQPMLANKWEDYAHKVTYPLQSQPKLDGIRCIVKADGMWTRTGKPIVSAPHVFESLQPLFKKDPTLILDGELYADKFANDFNAICSLVKKTKPTSADLKESKDKIEYHVYDMPSCEGSFIERYEELCSLFYYLEVLSNPYCILVETDVALDESDVHELYEQYIAEGYEGQMLRLDLPYENKRSKALLKHKSFIDEEYAIVGYEEGNGNLAGMIGALVFESKQGDKFTASVNGGWIYLTELWDHRDSLIGKQATIKYFNLTPDGKPRFPKVIAIRDYE